MGGRKGYGRKSIFVCNTVMVKNLFKAEIDKGKGYLLQDLSMAKDWECLLQSQLRLKSLLV